MVGRLGGGLVVALALGLGSGLIWLSDIVLRPLPSRIRAYPGQGISQSGRNALVFGLVGGLVLGLVGGLGLGLVFGLVLGLVDGLYFGLLIYGGEAFIRHHLLRWQLERQGLLPYHLQPFLDAMADRIILQRTGPSYRFIHRTLQEHLANMPGPQRAHLKWKIRSATSKKS